MPDLNADDTSADTTDDTTDDLPDPRQLTYEEARDELVDVVRRLETGGTGLEEALALWERGEALADRCQLWLDGARARLDTVKEPAPDED